MPRDDVGNSAGGRRLPRDAAGSSRRQLERAVRTENDMDAAFGQEPMEKRRPSYRAPGAVSQVRANLYSSLAWAASVALCGWAGAYAASEIADARIYRAQAQAEVAIQASLNEAMAKSVQPVAVACGHALVSRSIDGNAAPEVIRSVCERAGFSQ